MKKNSNCCKLTSMTVKIAFIILFLKHKNEKLPAHKKSNPEILEPCYIKAKEGTVKYRLVLEKYVINYENKN